MEVPWWNAASPKHFTSKLFDILKLDKRMSALYIFQILIRFAKTWIKFSQKLFQKAGKKGSMFNLDIHLTTLSLLSIDNAIVSEGDAFSIATLRWSSNILDMRIRPALIAAPHPHTLSLKSPESKKNKKQNLTLVFFVPPMARVLTICEPRAGQLP